MISIIVKFPVIKEGLDANRFGALLSNIHDSMPGFTRVSFEIFSVEGSVISSVACEEKNVATIKNLIYSQFPECELYTVQDMIKFYFEKFDKIWTTYQYQDTGGIFEYKHPDEVPKDTIADAINALVNVDSQYPTCLQVQLVTVPHNWLLKKLKSIKLAYKYFFRVITLKHLFKRRKPDEMRKLELQLGRNKIDYDGARVQVALMCAGPDPTIARAQLSSFKNCWISIFHIEIVHPVFTKPTALSTEDILSRKMKKWFYGNLPEISSITHFPDPSLYPQVDHLLCRRLSPPKDLPIPNEENAVSMIGTTSYRDQHLPFGILQSDRRRHLYIIGKSGSGKSKLMELLVKNDIESGQGLCLLDPHGDLVDAAVSRIPKDRIDDVILFDPADEDWPIGFNPLELQSPSMKIIVTQGFIDTFKKMFGANWSPRLEHVLRNTVLALLDTPNTTILGILQMLTDKNYRQKIIANITDDVVKSFWTTEFAGWSERFDAEAITPLLNKVGQFISTPMIRNIVAQPKNQLQFRKFMDEGKIILVKLSKGILGQENSAVMGAIIVTKIQEAAMSRADTPEEQRRDFNLYADEFQHFATDTYAEILSEARKYRLGLTMAHQYLGQLPENVRSTVFGNVGSFIFFRVGGDDAQFLTNELGHELLTPSDVANLNVQESYMKISVSGKTGEAFSSRVANVVPSEQSFKNEIVQHTRDTFATPRSEVEENIASWNDAESAEALTETIAEFSEPLV